MNSLFRPLGNIRLSAKVGGGFAATVVLTAVIGALGTLSILHLRDQSSIISETTSVVAQLQEVSAKREAYLESRAEEEATAAQELISGLGEKLTMLRDHLTDDPEGAQAANNALTAVSSLGAEFQAVVDAIHDEQSNAKLMIRSADRLGTLGASISDQMFSIAQAAKGEAKTAESLRNRANKLGLQSLSIRDGSQALAADLKIANEVRIELFNPDASASVPELASAVTGTEQLGKTVKKASRLKVDGVDPAMVSDMGDLIAAIKGDLATAQDQNAKIADRVAARRSAEAKAGQLVEQATLLRDTSFDIAETARKAAAKSGSQLTIVGLISVNADKFLREALSMRGTTMELFSSFGALEVEDVTNRVDIIQNIAGILEADSAAFPQIKDSVAQIRTETDAFNQQFLATAETRTLYSDALHRLGALSDEVRGQVTALAAQQSDATYDQAQTALMMIGIVLLASVGANVLIALVLSMVITKPTRRLTQAMAQLAEGDTSVEIPSTQQKDEIGDMSRTVQVFRDNAIERRRLEEVAREEQAQQSARRDEVEKLIVGFRDRVQGLLDMQDQTAREMDQTAQNLTTMAAHSAEQAADTSRVSEEANHSTENVASAAEELSASIAAIDSQVQRTTDIVSTATSAVDETNGKVQSLAESATKIGEVITLIQAIAEQTNLLALNATIEAARAGEAGKGFAVVASEVKELANQTSKATEDIASQISTIQLSTTDAVESINSILSTMQDVNSYTQAIAAAVSQQGEATNEISGNVLKASEGARAVSSNMSTLAGTVEKTQSASTTVLTAAGTLSERSSALKDEIETFLSRVAAA